MCTAVCTWGERALFGRTLDLEYHDDECVVLTPRRFAFDFRYGGRCPWHYAMLGTAQLCGGVPLYYDAINEHGLGVAALNFPDYNLYHAPQKGKRSLCSFEVIPFLLAHCTCVAEAVALLDTCVITPDAFRADLPPTPLHWMIADAQRAVVVESVREGLCVCENPFGVLTNAPDFAAQRAHLALFAGLDAASPDKCFLGGICPARGSGAVGLPGDFSSPSRFVRAAFVNAHAEGTPDEDAVSRFFHVMESVSVPNGCVRTERGECVRTVYTS